MKMLESLKYKIKNIIILALFPSVLSAQHLPIKHISLLPEGYENLIPSRAGGYIVWGGQGFEGFIFTETKEFKWTCNDSSDHIFVARLNKKAEIIDHLLICFSEGDLDHISIAEGVDQTIYIALSGYGRIEVNDTFFILPGSDNRYVYESSSLVLKMKNLKSTPGNFFLIEKSIIEDINTDDQGNLYLAGNYFEECFVDGERLSSTGTFQEESNQYLFKFDPDLNIIWKKIFATKLYNLSHGKVNPLKYLISLRKSKGGNLWFFSGFRVAIESNDLLFQLPESQTGFPAYDKANIGYILLNVNQENGTVEKYITFRNRWGVDKHTLIIGKEGNLHFFPANLEAMLKNNVITGPSWGAHGLIINGDTFPSKTLTYWHVIIDVNGGVEIKNDFDYFPLVKRFHQVLDDGSILLTYDYGKYRNELDNSVNDLLNAKGLDFGFYLVKLHPDGTPTLLREAYPASRAHLEGCNLYSLSNGAKDSFGIKDYPFPVIEWESGLKFLANSYFIVADVCGEEYSDYLFPPEIFIPNSFSPNGDNLNDLFEWSTISISESKIKIYSREGGRVVYSGGPGWDGTFKEKPAPEGMYGYALEAKTTNGKTIRKTGIIVLIR